MHRMFGYRGLINRQWCNVLQYLYEKFITEVVQSIGGRSEVCKFRTEIVPSTMKTTVTATMIATPTALTNHYNHVTTPPSLTNHYNHIPPPPPLTMVTIIVPTPPTPLL